MILTVMKRLTPNRLLKKNQKRSNLLLSTKKNQKKLNLKTPNKLKRKMTKSKKEMLKKTLD